MWTRLRALASRARFMIERRRLDDDLRQEIDGHLESLAERYRCQGMSADEAYLAARRQFGNPVILRQELREMNSVVWIEHAIQDVRHAFRQLRRTPAFAAIVVMTLAVGIGSTTAIFSVIEAVLLRPLPYPESHRLVRIIEELPEHANQIGYQQSLAGIWTRDLPTLRAQASTLSRVGVYSPIQATVTIDSDSSLRLEGNRVSPSILDMLGVRPALGRIFRSEEETLSAAPVVVISDAMWRQYLGGRADVLGHEIVIDGTAATIVGVTPPAFQFPDAGSMFWLPYPLGGRMQRLAPLAQLADGVTIEAASANVDAVLQQIRATEPKRPGVPSGPSRFDVRTIQEHLVAPVRPVLLVLALAVAFVLLIACVNVTHLLLNRNAARRQELAVRVALGASPGRVVRYVLTETLLLAALGGVAGVSLAFGTLSLLRTLGTSLARRDLTPGVSIPRLEEIQIDGTSLRFALASTLCVGLLVGLLPVVRYALARHLDTLKVGLHTLANVHAGPSRRWHTALVVAQTALATVAMIGSGLLMHSFVKLANVDPGYEPSNLLTFTVRSASASVPFSEEVAARLRVLPGVRSAGYAELLPMVRFRTGGPLAPAQPMPAGTPAPPEPIDMRTVSYDFVSAMGMKIVSGRTLRQDDEHAVLMNETLARSGFLGPNALGQHVMVAGLPDPFEVVGIVKDVRQYGLDQDPDPQVFVDARGTTARKSHALLRAAC